MEVIGWIAVALVGAYLAASAVFVFMTGMGLRGLDSVPGALLFGGVTAVAWIAFIVWLSPLTLGWG